MTDTKQPVTGFRGLNTVSDPFALDHSWQTRADNCVITDKGKLQRARGFTRATTNTAITGAYATEDLKRLYLVDDGNLLQVNVDFTTRVLATGLAATPARFSEINGVVYYSNGVDLGVIDNEGARPWGIAPPASVGLLTAGAGRLQAGLYRVCCTLTDVWGQESGNGTIAALLVNNDSLITIGGIPQVAGYTTNVYVTAQNGTVFYLLRSSAPATITYNDLVDDLAVELPFLFANAPHGVYPAFFGGLAYLADPYPTLDISAIWKSYPLHYHLFDDGHLGAAVPGTVLMLKAADTALIIGTERAVYALDEEGVLRMLAPYGVVPGDHAYRYEGVVYFWTLRGLCKALPFQNLTESTISVAPGLSACGRVIEQDGFKRFVVAMRRGGAAYNPYVP